MFIDNNDFDGEKAYATYFEAFIGFAYLINRNRAEEIFLEYYNKYKISRVLSSLISLKYE